MPRRPATHQNEWQFRELARAVSEMGYNVDAIEFNERGRSCGETTTS